MLFKCQRIPCVIIVYFLDFVPRHTDALNRNNKDQHPMPKRSDLIRSESWPRPGEGIGISAGMVEKAVERTEVERKEEERQNRSVAHLGEKLQALSFLKTLGGTLSMTKESSQWQQPIITIDSEASESVATAGAASNVQIVESLGSRSGVIYEVANGQVIDNLGQKDCIVVARGGSMEQSLLFQISEVHRLLLSVSKLLAVGKRVIFDDEWSYIEDKFTGERLTLVPKDGLFELHCWVRPEQDFPRPGRERTTPHL